MSISDSASGAGSGDPPSSQEALYEHEVSVIASSCVQDVAPCPICRGTRARPRYVVGHAQSSARRALGICEGCGHGRLEPMPSPDEIRSFYPEDYYGLPGQKFRPLIERLVRFVGRRHVRFLTQGLEHGARVLDVGCGRGVLLDPLADLGFEVHGVEISAEATRGADPRAEIRIAQDLGAAAYSDATFDLVVIWHVLEHLVDPRATLSEIHRILRPGGKVAVAVPNLSSWQAVWSGANWFHLDLPRHLHHFTLEGLERLLAETGFETRSTHHFSLRQNPFGWIQSALNRLDIAPRNALYTILHRRDAAPRFAFPISTRLSLLALFVTLTPIALIATLAATAARRGGTVHIVAEK